MDSNQFNNQVNNQLNNQVNNQVNHAQVRENEQKGRGLFYGIIAVATFIIMAVGATYAYFTATTGSASSSVRTRSTTLNLKFISYNSAWMSEDLIPSADYIVAHSFLNQNDTTLVDSAKNNNILCRDDSGSAICSVYVFQVYNSNSQDQQLSISLESTNNEFTNLWVMGFALNLPSDTTDYDSNALNNQANDPSFLTGSEEEGADTSNLIPVTSGTGTQLTMGSSFGATRWSENEYFPVYANRKGVEKTLWKVTNTEKTARVSSNVAVAASGSEVLVADGFTVEGGKVGTFALVLYIKETGENQTLDDGGENGKLFEGTVKVATDDNPDAAITGQINGIVKTDIDNLLNSSETISGGSGGTSSEPGGSGSGSDEPSGGEPSGGEPTNP